MHPAHAPARAHSYTRQRDGKESGSCDGITVSTSRDMRSNAALLNECRSVFDAWERLSSSRVGVFAMFAWACAEATLWPIIPEFLLVPMAVANRRRFYVPLASAVVGAAIGGIAIYGWAFAAPHAALEFVRHLPFVRDEQIGAVQDELQRHGISALFRQPWSGISFKVWGVSAGAQRLSPGVAIPAFIAARGLRMTIFATLSAALSGGPIRRFLRDYSLYVVVAYVALFFFGWWQVVA